ncbi:ClC family H(+)/Cl(-) exchange transporter [Fervidobacterium pennivorans]|uniref:ClC family H(+)/Cl(-) exchange transporter n=1 Tax=Fervidobacterium pennivorans TaxID=93466 RepID=UPI00143689AB|nr:ClC family H(+)/Cl(-) exchange transporter [Fervidobacterium pennivorans]QIV78350.1 ClC family H(+)/Cl(-) exchange transporter [Fervidobacterium pennivorans subsp. keratinolyticus]
MDNHNKGLKPHRESITEVFLGLSLTKNKLVFKGAIVGFLSGLVVISYRLGIHNADILRENIRKLALYEPKFLILIFGIFIVNSFVITKLVKSEPMISGSGIPQIRGKILRQFDYNPFSVLFKKFLGGILAILNGFSLGREGPSIQLGGTIGLAVSKLWKANKIEEKYLITAGASAGLAAAFNAPLAGVVFALEELHKSFSSSVLIVSMVAAIVADFVSKIIFGLNPALSFTLIQPIELRHYLLLLLLGALTGIFGVIFNRTLLKFSALFDTIRLKVFLVSLLCIFLLFWFPEVLSGGHELILEIYYERKTIGMLLVLLIFKFLLTVLSYATSAPGGIFLPILAIGALFGDMVYNMLTAISSLPGYKANFIVLGMVGYFTSVVRAPITGIVLITEMVGSFNHILELSVVAFSLYFTAELMREEPIYESLLKRMLMKKAKTEKHEESPEHDYYLDEKTLIEIPINTGSELDGVMIKDFPWPKGCLVVLVKRGSAEIIPNGKLILQGGDILTVLCSKKQAVECKMYLISKATNERSFNKPN